MSDNYRKNYDLDNFVDNQKAPRHMRADDDNEFGYGDNFDFEEVGFEEKTTNQNMDEEADDYGDDFYSDSDMFDSKDDTKPFVPVKDDEYSKYNRNDYADDKKKKPVAVIVLSVILGLVVLAVAILFVTKFAFSDSDKPTESTQPTTEATEATEATELIEAATEPEVIKETEYVEPEPETEPQVIEETEYVEPEPVPETEPLIIEETVAETVGDVLE